MGQWVRLVGHRAGCKANPWALMLILQSGPLGCSAGLCPALWGARRLAFYPAEVGRPREARHLSSWHRHSCVYSSLRPATPMRPVIPNPVALFANGGEGSAFPPLRRGGACPAHLLSFGGSGAYPGNANLPSAFDCPISFSRSLFASGGLRSPKVDLLSS